MCRLNEIHYESKPGVSTPRNSHAPELHTLLHTHVTHTQTHASAHTQQVLLVSVSPGLLSSKNCISCCSRLLYSSPLTLWFSLDKIHINVPPLSAANRGLEQKTKDRYWWMQKYWDNNKVAMAYVFFKEGYICTRETTNKHTFQEKKGLAIQGSSESVFDRADLAAYQWLFPDTVGCMHHLSGKRHTDKGLLFKLAT